uniref:RNA helicase n=1 Tax=Anopheles culicifacies TaxID=139723 RepID=A0A182LXQ0_9DIPT
MASKAKINVKIEEDIRISIHRQIDLFLQDENQIEYDFPSELTNQHRAYIHEYVRNKQLKSKSNGKGANRYLTICKTSLPDIAHNEAVLNVTLASSALLKKIENCYSISRKPSKRLGKAATVQSHSINVTSAAPSIPPLPTGCAEIHAVRNRLPIAQFHAVILKCIQQNQVLIISGNTGSGKTTQVPQYILEEAAQTKQPCRIICTQPRRISAVTVAERVCYERNEPLGDTVGYQIRLESRAKPTTNALYCTNGVLLRCLMGKGCSNFLKHITHIIIDEVHERDQYSDFLLIALKDNLTKNPHLKIILMSATIESDTFSKYFNNAPVIEIPGRLYPIEIVFLEDVLFNIETSNHNVRDVRKNIIENTDGHAGEGFKPLLDAYHTSVGDDRIDHTLIFDIIMYICQHKSDGGILVFLPGYEDIQEQYGLINSKAPNLQSLRVLMLHSKMQTTDQHSVFKPVPPGVRKIILSTNIAETSITMDDVVYVIDSGKVKQKYYDSLTSTSLLAATWISQACATQRAGRAGRTRPGTCFRLYSRTRHSAMDQYALPEILRVPLTEICLQTALIMQDASIQEFLNKAITPPAAISIKQSIKYLQKVGALDDDENVTDLGYTLAELPVDARLGKMLLYGILLKCYEPVLLIVCILSVNDLFVIPPFAGDKERAKKMRRDLADNSYSDCYSLLRAYQRWLDIRSVAKRKELCNRLFLNHGKLTMVHDLRNKIHSHLCTIGIVKAHGTGYAQHLNEYSTNWSMVKCVLLVGLYPNVCYLEKYSNKLKTRFEKKIFIHPSSVVDAKKSKEETHPLSLPSEWITFEEKCKTGRASMIRCNTVVSPISIAMFAGPSTVDESECVANLEDDDEQCRIVLDDWINLTANRNVVKSVLHVRQALNELFLKFIENPRAHQSSAAEHKLLECLGKILAAEDESMRVTNQLPDLAKPAYKQRGESSCGYQRWR